MLNIFKDKIEESIWVRGVCAAIQAMAMPTLDSLINLFDKAGYTLTITKKS